MKRTKNTSRKGNQYQRLARAILEAQGYEVEVCRPTIIWLAPGRPISKATDFFGRLDLIGVHPDKPPRLVQVSVQSELSRKRALLQGWQPNGCVVEVWLYHGGRGRHFRVYAAPGFTEYKEEKI